MLNVTDETRVEDRFVKAMAFQHLAESVGTPFAFGAGSNSCNLGGLGLAFAPLRLVSGRSALQEPLTYSTQREMGDLLAGAFRAAQMIESGSPVSVDAELGPWSGLSSAQDFIRGQRVKGLQDYLRHIASEGFTSTPTVNAALDAWDDLDRSTGGSLPVPNASAGPDGMLLLTWDRGEHHLELEFLVDSTASFFYFNRNTHGAWEIEYTKPVRNELHAAFRVFF